VKASNSCVRILIFSSFLLLSFIKFFPFSFCAFSLSVLLSFLFFIWFFIAFCFPLIFRSYFVLFSHGFISNLSLTCLGIKGLVVVVEILYSFSINEMVQFGFLSATICTYIVPFVIICSDSFPF
jgi:hypothetical protein